MCSFNMQFQISLFQESFIELRFSVFVPFPFFGFILSGTSTISMLDILWISSILLLSRKSFLSFSSFLFDFKIFHVFLSISFKIISVVFIAPVFFLVSYSFFSKIFLLFLIFPDGYHLISEFFLILIYVVPLIVYDFLHVFQILGTVWSAMWAALPSVLPVSEAALFSPLFSFILW